MPPQSQGSFGANAGGMSPELQAAMQRRQTQGGATAQVTQEAPGFNPATQPAQPPTGQAPQPQMGAQPMGQPTPDQSQQAQPATPNMPYDPAELKMITGALTGRLKLLGGIQQAIVGIPSS
jgi:hypothetical protein